MNVALIGKSILPVVIAVAASGCVSLSGLASVSDEVITRTREGCRFVPSVASILSLLNVPGAAVATEIADKICDAVEQKSGSESLRLGGELSVEIDGKTVTGFVSR